MHPLGQILTRHLAAAPHSLSPEDKEATNTKGAQASAPAASHRGFLRCRTWGAGCWAEGDKRKRNTGRNRVPRVCGGPLPGQAPAGPDRAPHEAAPAGRDAPARADTVPRGCAALRPASGLGGDRPQRPRRHFQRGAGARRLSLGLTGQRWGAGAEPGPALSAGVPLAARYGWEGGGVPGKGVLVSLSGSPAVWKGWGCPSVVWGWGRSCPVRAAGAGAEPAPGRCGARGRRARRSSPVWPRASCGGERCLSASSRPGFPSRGRLPGLPGRVSGCCERPAGRVEEAALGRSPHKRSGQLGLFVRQCARVPDWAQRQSAGCALAAFDAGDHVARGQEFVTEGGGR